MEKVLVDRIHVLVKACKNLCPWFDSRGMFTPDDLYRLAKDVSTNDFCRIVGELEDKMWFWVNREKEGTEKHYAYGTAWGLLHDCILAVRGGYLE